MSVAIFTDNDFDKVNGVTTTLKAVLRFAADARPRIYTAAEVGVETPEYFAPESIGIGLPWYREMRIYAPRLRAFAKQLRADRTEVVHVTTPGPVGIAGRWLARRLGLPVVGSYHTNLGDYTATYSGSARLGAALEAYMRWVYAPCDPLLVPSDATRTLLSRRGYRTDRLRIWSRGVDAECFRPDRRSHALRDRWHVDDRRPAVLYAGRLSREKGLELVEPLERELKRRDIPHQLVFAGDGPMRAELQQRCPDAIFLGTLSQADVAVAMASSDVFLFPSATDTLGNVVLEAQASGLPVIVSDQGGPSQHMLSFRSGLVCQTGDATAFASAVAMILTDADRRASMRASAREYARMRDWPRSLQPLFSAWTGAARAGRRAVGTATVHASGQPLGEQR